MVNRFSERRWQVSIEQMVMVMLVLLGITIGQWLTIQQLKDLLPKKK